MGQRIPSGQHGWRLGKTRAIDALYPPSLRSGSSCRFFPDWHWTNQALKPSLPTPDELDVLWGRKRAGPPVATQHWLAFRTSCSPILVPGLAVRGSSNTLGLRAAGQEKSGGGGMSAGKMAAAAAGVGRLEEEALRRKERLKALREKTGRKVRNAE